jgi:hypothetical protein
MARSQLEQWQASAPEPNSDPATAAAITLVSEPGFGPPLQRPRWQWGVAIAAALTALGSLGWLFWWLLLRTPPSPHVLDFSPAASQYTVIDQKTPLLNWQISHPRQVETLILRTFTPEGMLVGEPRRYDLSEALPVELLAYCDQTRNRLTCQEVPTEVREPGQYRFELTLIPRSALNLAPVQASSSLVSIADLPTPTVLELAPQQVIYSEAGTQVTANTPTLAPAVTAEGIRVSWIVNHPAALQDLLLVVRQPDGTTLGGRRFTLRNPQNPTQVALPDELQPFCQLGQDLVCQGVPTGMTEVGKYQFELTPIPINSGDEDFPAAKVSEVVEIQPRPVRIAAFMINGREADPKYLVPVVPGQPIPGFRLDWRVEGGATTQVELLPSPGTVGLGGTLRLPLNPSGTTTITLRVTDGQNPPLLRAVTFETFNPNPNPPIIVNPNGSGQGTANTPPQTPPAQAQQRPAPPAPTRPTPGELPGTSLQESEASEGRTLLLPEDLQNRSPADLNLQF